MTDPRAAPPEPQTQELVTRLRADADEWASQCGLNDDTAKLEREAADEIERQRRELQAKDAEWKLQEQLKYRATTEVECLRELLRQALINEAAPGELVADIENAIGEQP